MSDLLLSLWVTDEGKLVTSSELPNVTKSNSFKQFGQGIEAQRERVFEFLRQHPQGLSNQEIEEKTGMRISSITARVNELRKQGLIACGGARTNERTGKLNAFWMVQQ